MPQRFLCLQGHPWTGDTGPTACPTCGLRLHPENDLVEFVPATAPVAPLPTVPLPAPVPVLLPTPLFNTDIFRLSRSADGLPPPEIKPSDIEEIPGYELLGILGHGGMGIVFRARQVSLKRQVALKMILAGRHARPDDRMRFQKEAEAVARLHHPNIVQIYEVGQQKDLPYFSLEFVNAGSLAQFLGGTPQPPRDAAQFVMELARAMHYAHKRGIVHRDLKPANILLYLDESTLLKDGRAADAAVFRELASYVPKISDFGLAKHVGRDEHVRQGSILGTPSYMAPEQASGSRDIGPAADVYALGAVLYEMVTGRPPFKAATMAETAQQVLHQEPVPPTQLQPKVSRDLETICLTCLQKDPERRYASADALGEDLRRFLDNEPILARPTALPERVLKWSRRRPAMAAAFVFAACVAGLLFEGWGQMTFELRSERDEAQREFARSQETLQQALATIDQIAADTTPPSPEQTRQRMQQAVKFYEGLVRDTRDRPPLRPVTAHAWQRLGDLHRQLGNATIAATAYREAAQLFAHLSEEFPARPEYARRLNDCREGIRLASARGEGPALP